jgi:hypothetical protein
MIQKDFQDVRKIEQIVSSEISPREKKQVSAPPTMKMLKMCSPYIRGMWCLRQERRRMLICEALFHRYRTLHEDLLRRVSE